MTQLKNQLSQQPLVGSYPNLTNRKEGSKKGLTNELSVLQYYFNNLFQAFKFETAFT
jgi:hypothetical protein